MQKSVDQASSQNKALQDTVLEKTKKIQELEYQLKEQTEEVDKLSSLREEDSQKLMKYTDQLK
jgi:predicted  nucleic acid-binding Zn-ribbon protein